MDGQSEPLISVGAPLLLIICTHLAFELVLQVRGPQLLLLDVLRAVLQVIALFYSSML